MKSSNNEQAHDIGFRLFNMNDYNALQAIYSNEHVCQYLPVEGVVPDDRIKKILASYSDTLSHPKDGIVYAVTFKGNIIGYAGVKHVKEYDKYEIYYGIHPDYWGHGYATTAANYMKALAKRRGLKEVIAFAHIDNPASQRVLEKIGYTKVEQITLWKLPLYYYHMSL